jgi:preprotein translocase subunit SecB
MNADPAPITYQIKFLDAILHHSFAAPLPNEHEHEHTGLRANIQVNIYQNQVQALLQVEYILIIDEETHEGYGLNFGILGSLEAPKEMPQEELADYAKIYSLSFLWPYAREYSSSLIRRMSINAVPLPIINPQTMTKMMVDEGLVQVDILDNRPSRNTTTGVNER